MLRHTCILWHPQTTGDKIRIGFLTTAFLGAQKRAERLCHPWVFRDPQTKGDKIKIGCLTLLRAAKEGGHATSPFSGIPEQRGSDVAFAPSFGPLIWHG